MPGSNTESSQSDENWWPNSLNLDILQQHDSKTYPIDTNYNYQQEVKTLDFESLKKDLTDL